MANSNIPLLSDTLRPSRSQQSTAFDVLVNEDKSNLPAKERWLGCEFDGFSFVMDALYSNKTKAGAAAFFFVTKEPSTEEVEVSDVPTKLFPLSLGKPL